MQFMTNPKADNFLNQPLLYVTATYQRLKWPSCYQKANFRYIFLYIVLGHILFNSIICCSARPGGGPRQAGPGLGLSPPTHCQLGCFSKARKQVTQASHLPHTPTYTHTHTQTHTSSDLAVSNVQFCHPLLILSQVF